MFYIFFLFKKIGIGIGMKLEWNWNEGIIWLVEKLEVYYEDWGVCSVSKDDMWICEVFYSFFLFKKIK